MPCNPLSPLVPSAKQPSFMSLMKEAVRQVFSLSFWKKNQIFIGVLASIGLLQWICMSILSPVEIIFLILGGVLSSGISIMCMNLIIFDKNPLEKFSTASFMPFLKRSARVWLMGGFVGFFMFSLGFLALWSRVSLVVLCYLVYRIAHPRFRIYFASFVMVLVLVISLINQQLPTSWMAPLVTHSFFQWSAPQAIFAVLASLPIVCLGSLYMIISTHLVAGGMKLSWRTVKDAHHILYNHQTQLWGAYVGMTLAFSIICTPLLVAELMRQGVLLSFLANVLMILYTSILGCFIALYVKHYTNFSEVITGHS